MSSDKKNRQRGQIIVEYILLLVIVVGLAALIVRGVVHRDKDEPGFLIKAWNNMIQTIGADTP